MRSIILLFTIAGAACGASLRHTYKGSDPAHWTHELLDEAAAAAAGEFTTYVGSAPFDYKIARILTDTAGNTYVTGSRLVTRTATDFPVYDVFLTKLDAAGATLFTVTLGGKGNDQAAALALDPAGNIYLGGTTSSANFPLRYALQTSPSPSGSAFLVKLSPDGSQLLYSTYFGGVRGPGSIAALATDSAGNLYAGGTTLAADFPHTDGMPWSNVSFGGPPITSGAFVAKLAPGGDKVLYGGALAGHTLNCTGGSSCFLGTRSTAGTALAVDAGGSAYLAGNTNTTDLPTTPGALKAQGIGAFAAKFNAAGTGLSYLTYVGSGSTAPSPSPVAYNTAMALAVDAAGNAYLAGYTSDPNFPATPGAVQTKYAGAGTSSYLPDPDAFLLKLNPLGTAPVWGSYLGGAGPDSAQSLALDAAGNAWLAGTTSSTEFPNANGWSQGNDFLVAFGPAGDRLVYSARYPSGSVSQSVAPDPQGRIHVAGPTGILSAIQPGGTPDWRIFGLMNAAGGSFDGRVVPGEIISIYGPRIGPAVPVTVQPENGYFPKAAGGVQVLFDGLPAPLLYVSSTQINAVVPSSLANVQSAKVTIFSQGVPSPISPGLRSPEFPVTVLGAIPEIFKNTDGSAAAVDEKGSLNSPGNPAPAGSIVSIWITGAGWFPNDGQINTEARNSYCCEVSVQGKSAEVLYSGPAPGLVAGASQINFRIPDGLYIYNNMISVTVRAGGRSSQEAIICATP